MSPIHDRTLRLLPWYVNGTLPSAEQEEVEAHLGECLTCHAALRREFELCKRIRSQADLPLTSRAGFADLVTRLDKARAGPFVARFGPRLTFGIGLFGLLAVGLVLLRTPDSPFADRDPSNYSTLSQTAESAEVRIDLIFAEGVDDETIEALVSDIGGQIVAGPSELGRYTLALRELSPADLASLLEELSADPDVRFAGRTFIDADDSREEVP